MKNNRSIRNSFFALTLMLSIMLSMFLASAISNAQPELPFKATFAVLLIGSTVISFGMKEKAGILSQTAAARYQTGYRGGNVPTIIGTGNSMLQNNDEDNCNVMKKPMNVAPAQWDHFFSDRRSFESANVYPYPDSITIIVKSINAGGGGAGGDVDVFLINQDELNDVTDNGTGANSIQYTYQDNNRGKVISRIITNARAGMGLVCYGIAIRMEITATAAGDAAGVAATNPRFGVDNGMGDFIPLNFNTTSRQFRSDQDTSLITIPCIQNITNVTQLKLRMKYLDTATVTVYFIPDWFV